MAKRCQYYVEGQCEEKLISVLKDSGVSLVMPKKLQRLIKIAGISKIDFENKIVAIKLHFGELGNISYLRPNYVKAVVDVVKQLGGIPFLTDCNTLYPGSRKNAIEHLLTMTK